MKTITLHKPHSFEDALKKMLKGHCLGINPGETAGFIEKFKPMWMNKRSPDFMLRWHGTDSDSNIRSNQFLGSWFLVILDHNSIQETVIK